MRYSINVHGHTEPVEISSEPGRVVVCGLGYLPFEADMIGEALRRCADDAETKAASAAAKLQPADVVAA